VIARKSFSLSAALLFLVAISFSPRSSSCGIQFDLPEENRYGPSSPWLLNSGPLLSSPQPQDEEIEFLQKVPAIDGILDARLTGLRKRKFRYVEKNRPSQKEVPVRRKE